MGFPGRTAMRPAAWVFYVVIVLEFLFMISPVALTFYSAYEPVLRVFHRSPLTAWMTGFFLPHFSVTSSPILNGIKPIGMGLAALGLLLFVVGAVQIYGSKILRRGTVNGGLYRWIRHPQYLALGILGLGITVIWPRFLVLLTFATMVLLYSLLARMEEERLVAAFGEEYEAVRRTRGMFLPRAWEAPARKIGARLGPWTARRAATAYIAGLTVALGAGFGLREWTLGRVSGWFEGRVAILSPALLPDAELRSAVRLAVSVPEVASVLSQPGPPVLIYVVPESWYVPDLPLHSEEEIRRVGGGHRTTAPVEGGRYKVLFTYTRTHDERATGKDIVRTAYGLDPILTVSVSLTAGTVTDTTVPPRHVIWGDIPIPLF